MNLSLDQNITRLPDFEYSMPRAYFITVCAINRSFLFETTNAMLAIESAWCSVLDIFTNIELDEFVVMPNHVHGIVWVTGEVSYRPHLGKWTNDIPRMPGQPPISTTPTELETINSVIKTFKTIATVRINQLQSFVKVLVWQKSFYNRIVRDDRELDRIQEYICNNPKDWMMDRDNPASPYFGPPARSIDDYWGEIFN
jgi:REP-associated tyrosine transposase